jgi:hypothetical protein
MAEAREAAAVPAAETERPLTVGGRGHLDPEPKDRRLDPRTAARRPPRLDGK